MPTVLYVAAAFPTWSPPLSASAIQLSAFTLVGLSFRTYVPFSPEKSRHNDRPLATRRVAADWISDRETWVGNA